MDPLIEIESWDLTGTEILRPCSASNCHYTGLILLCDARGNLDHHMYLHPKCSMNMLPKTSAFLRLCTTLFPAGINFRI